MLVASHTFPYIIKFSISTSCEKPDNGPDEKIILEIVIILDAVLARTDKVSSHETLKDCGIDALHCIILD